LRQLSLESKEKLINNAVHFPTNSILNDEIKKNKLKTIKRPKTKKKHIILVGKLIKPLNRVSQTGTPNL